MWKKTVLRRHTKVLPMSPRYNRLADLDDRADTNLPQYLEDNAEAMKEATIVESGDESENLTGSKNPEQEQNKSE